MKNEQQKRAFTPGPWHVGETNKNFSPKVYGSDGRMTAGCADIHRRTDEETAANAKLIAAAPDLLESLQDLLYAYREVAKLYEPYSGNDLTNKAHNAIQKAIGQ